ncbi:hypothetical protein ACWDVU_14280 [Streptomyces sp. NPDC003333]
MAQRRCRPDRGAERAGNSVKVLLTRYAKCLDGRQNVANRLIEDLLREYEWRHLPRHWSPWSLSRGSCVI